MFRLIGQQNTPLIDQYCSELDFSENAARLCVKSVLPSTNILKFARRPSGELFFLEREEIGADEVGYRGKAGLIL